MFRQASAACRILRPTLLSVAFLSGSLAAASGQQAALAPELQARIASAVRAILARGGIPAAQVGIVQHGQVVYTAAFGSAQLAPADSANPVPATPEMPFRIGSVSKQFTAAAVLLLAEQGKLRLDDPVATWFPELGHAREVTLRQLLNQVSGYSDYYTEDYLTPELARPIAPLDLAREWTGRPLDFAPGSRWQYSNTNYLLAALIVEKVAGDPFFDFLEEKILRPAGMTHALNLDAPGVPAVPQGYFHYGFGPARPVPLEGAGTLLGAAELAMPIADLMRWDTVVLRRSLLAPASWQTLEAEASLPDGTGTGYAMGLFVAAETLGGKPRRVLEHSGEVNGFTTVNQLFPAQDTAIAATINAESGAEDLVAAIGELLFAPTTKPAAARDPKVEALLRTVLAQLQQGRVDRGLLAPNLDFFFTPQALADYKASLAPLGAIKTLTAQAAEERGGMTFYACKAQGTGRAIGLSVYVTRDGKLDQLLLEKLD
jgi:CubicO group peptidase (beta-lactamase class C family)